MKTGFAHLVTAMIGCLTLAMPAAAQDSDPVEGTENNAGMQTGTRFFKEPETASAAEARSMQKRVARCIFDRKKRQVRDVLQNSNFYEIHFDALPYEMDEMFDQLGFSPCLGRLMRGADNTTYQMYARMQYSTLRNLLAEEAYIEDYDAPPAIGPEDAQDIASRFGGERVHPQISTMAALADCVTFNAPQAGDDLLRSRPGSSAEDEAVETLGPVLATCANSSEPELSISTSLIRQIVADGLWTRASAMAAR